MSFVDVTSLEQKYFLAVVVAALEMPRLVCKLRIWSHFNNIIASQQEL